MKLSETIKEITRNHLENNNGLLFGQSVTAVGWINGTVPDCKGIIELPMCDVAGSGFAVGAAIAGKRPILVIRYQDFITLGLSPIINYAAKSKQFFGKGCPIFVRLLADEGKGLGPVHSGRIHSLFMHFPGLKVVAPITPSEYENCWDQFMKDDDPYVVIEHRGTFSNDSDINDIMYFDDSNDVTIYAISYARMNALKAVKELSDVGIKCNFSNIVWLKPSRFCMYGQKKFGVVVDTGFTNCGASESIAYQLMEKTGQRIYAMGLKDYSMGCTKETENLTPSVEEIVKFIMDKLNC